MCRMIANKRWCYYNDRTITDYTYKYYCLTNPPSIPLHEPDDLHLKILLENDFQMHSPDLNKYKNFVFYNLNININKYIITGT